MRKRIIITIILLLLTFLVIVGISYMKKNSEYKYNNDDEMIENSVNKDNVSIKSDSNSINNDNNNIIIEESKSVSDENIIVYESNYKDNGIENEKRNNKNKNKNNVKKNSKEKTKKKSNNIKTLDNKENDNQNKNNETKNENEDNLIIGKASNLTNEKERNEIEKIIRNERLDNIDIFISLLKEFNSEPYDKCGIVDKWTDFNKIKYDEFECADRWEKNHEISDGNCRMTAFLLLNNHIQMNKTIKESGSYLMFDMDIIENNKDYQELLKKQDNFITLYNEMDVSGLDNEEIKNTYKQKWKDYGIKIKDGDASLITVVMHDNYSDIVFVGHAGVLVDLKDKLLFIEKIAFEQPYQITVFKSREQLKEMLFSRETYFGDETEQGPFIYENDKLLYTYSK